MTGVAACLGVFLCTLCEGLPLQRASQLFGVRLIRVALCRVLVWVWVFTRCASMCVCIWICIYCGRHWLEDLCSIYPCPGCGGNPYHGDGRDTRSPHIIMWGLVTSRQLRLLLCHTNSHVAHNFKVPQIQDILLTSWHPKTFCRYIPMCVYKKNGKRRDQPRFTTQRVRKMRVPLCLDLVDQSDNTRSWSLPSGPSTTCLKS